MCMNIGSSTSAWETYQWSQPQEKSASSSSSHDQRLLSPQVVVMSSSLTHPVMFAALILCQSCVGSQTAIFMSIIPCHVQKMTFHKISPHLSALQFFPPFLPQHSMSLGGVAPLKNEPLAVPNC